MDQISDYRPYISCHHLLDRRVTAIAGPSFLVYALLGRHGRCVRDLFLANYLLLLHYDNEFQHNTDDPMSLIWRALDSASIRFGPPLEDGIGQLPQNAELLHFGSSSTFCLFHRNAYELDMWKLASGEYQIKREDISYILSFDKIKSIPIWIDKPLEFFLSQEVELLPKFVNRFRRNDLSIEESLENRFKYDSLSELNNKILVSSRWMLAILLASASRWASPGNNISMRMHELMDDCIKSWQAWSQKPNRDTKEQVIAAETSVLKNIYLAADIIEGLSSDGSWIETLKARSESSNMEFVAHAT